MSTPQKLTTVVLTQTARKQLTASEFEFMLQQWCILLTNIFTLADIKYKHSIEMSVGKCTG